MTIATGKEQFALSLEKGISRLRTIRHIMSEIIFRGTREDLIKSLGINEEADSEFFGNLDFASLRERYSDLTTQALADIEPVWDLAPEAINWNLLGGDALEVLHLYSANRECFLEAVNYPSDYTSPDLSKHSSRNSLLRVIGHWELGQALTPPVFTLTCGRLQKLDGHHRTCVAIAAGAEAIPFYCKLELSLPGVVRVEQKPTH